MRAIPLFGNRGYARTDERMQSAHRRAGYASPERTRALVADLLPSGSAVAVR
jgi:hypothetical protein